MPALPDDTMAPFFDQLHRTGEPVHIATLHGNELVVVALVPYRPARHAGPPVDDEGEFPLRADVSVSLVVDYLILREGPILIREISPQVCIELLERAPERC